MPRWEPGTRDRLERAALRLFAEHGYPAVAVPEIARAAGVTRATFFRVFADKREVLFWGQDLLAERFSSGIRDAPSGSSTVELVTAALRSVAPSFPDERHELAAPRDEIVAGQAELRERLAGKRAVLRDAIETALQERGIDADEALVAAELGRTAFSAAYHRWAIAPEPQDFAALAERTLHELLAAAGRLGAAAAAE